MDGATLIFPATTQAALDEAAVLREHGVRVVLAASVPPDVLRTANPEWILLPYVSDPGFPTALRRLVDQHGIARISAPVQSAHRFLAELLADGDWPVRLIGQSPVEAAVAAHVDLMESAAQAGALVEAIASPQSGITEEQLAALLRTAGAIYGESAPAKLAALAGIFATAPQGDVVEIGALLGRSTATLALLAAWHRTGTVLAIDPWNSGDPVRRDAPGYVTRMNGSWADADMEAMFRVNMMGVATAPFGCLAMPSSAARPTYGPGETVNGPLGPATLRGRIAVLHIDGNHDEDVVLGDCRDWVPQLEPSGWLVLDDYRWAHGIGPRRAGDLVLTRNADRIARAFVVAGALFVQFSDRPVA